MKTSSLLKQAHIFKSCIPKHDLEALKRMINPSHEEIRPLAEEIYRITGREDSLQNWEDAEIVVCLLAIHRNIKAKATGIVLTLEERELKTGPVQKLII